MASISDERLREMEEEMDRFEAEIEGPQDGGEGGAGPGFILGSNTFDRVQARLTAIRQDMSTAPAPSSRGAHPPPPPPPPKGRESNFNQYGDEDFRHQQGPRAGQKRRIGDRGAEEEEEFYDIDERPGRPQGPPIAAPPPPPPPPPGGAAPHPAQNMFAPPPPPPPESSGGPPRGLAPPPPPPPRPAFMPPQLRHRPPRPPFPPRPPHGGMIRMGPPEGLHPPPPPGQYPPQRRPMMGPQMGPMGPNSGPMGPPGPNPRPMGPPGPSLGPMGPPGPIGSMAGPVAPGMERPPGNFMTPGMESGQQAAQISAGPTVVEQPKVVYAAAPMITVERKKEEKKKKKKKKKDTGDDGTSETSGGDSIGPTPPSSVATSSAGDSSLADMEVVPASAGGIFMGGNQMGTPASGVGPGMGNMNLPMGAMMAGNPASVQGGTAMASGIPGAPGTGKKEKKKKEKKFIRLAANTTWEDPTLSEWAQDDFRMFCGDLGNEVTDETLVRAFNKYPSFLKAKVVRDRRTNKTKGYGFVSFKDPIDFTRAMREMNGKYVGNRPIKLRKSAWRDRNLEVVRKKEKEKKRLGMK